MMVIVMNSVLVISKTEKSVEPLEQLMTSAGYDNVVSAFASVQAEELAGENDFDVIVINTPILDGGGIELSLRLSKSTTSGIFVLLKSEVYEKCCEALESGGVFAIKKPLNRSAFCQYLKIWEISKRRLGKLKNENAKLKSQVEEMKIINRAKFALMQCLTMSEHQAHRYIEKQAMDLRISKLQVAQRVLSTYEL